MVRLKKQHASEAFGGVTGNFGDPAMSLCAALFFGVLLGGVAIHLIVRRRVRSVVQLASVQRDVMAAVSHEMRTAIAAVLCAGENFRDGLVREEDCLRQQGDVITTQANRLMTLVDQVMLNVGEVHVALGHDMQELNVADLIDDALRSVSFLLEKEQFNVRREIQPGLPSVTGELSMLSQCLQNFIVNAVKYSGESRWVGISAQVCVASNIRPKEIQISVRDQGPGIDEADREHIFEPYYRSLRPAVSSIRGTGLGLSIAKREAEACGGSISFASQKGLGSVFTLHLPLREDQAGSTVQQEAKDRGTA